MVGEVSLKLNEWAMFQHTNEFNSVYFQTAFENKHIIKRCFGNLQHPCCKLPCEFHKNKFLWNIVSDLSTRHPWRYWAETRVQKLTRISIQKQHGCHRNQIYIHVHLVASSFSLRKTRYCMEPLTSCQYRDIFCSTKNSQSQMYKDVHLWRGGSGKTNGGHVRESRCGWGNRKRNR